VIGKILMTARGAQGIDAAAITVGVIGAGVMGSGIAQSLAVAGCRVICQDVAEQVLERARASVASGPFGVSSAVTRGKLTQSQADQALDRLSFSTELGDAAQADLVIEAVPEVLSLKIKLFRQLDGLAAGDAVLATNSSGFPVSALAAATERPARVIGWHWASPAPVMKLAEIVRTPETSQETVDLVCRLAAAAGKNPVVVADAPRSWGYVANRIYGAAFQEAERIVREGVASPEQVDRLMVDCYRWPTGPYAMRTGATSGWT
jgi:3-hydroxybutyryl-CoA dehydrogenase/3-hydroxyacyl-CoA dehydrogenase